MSISSLNSFSPPSFASRPLKQGTASQADLSAASPDAASPEVETQSTLPAPNGAAASQGPKPRDADDKIIASWFKLMKPPSDRDSGFSHHDSKEDDPGRVPDPLYEPTKEHVPDSLQIITFNDLMRALAPKKPHWKHYDDASNQFQVGSQERD